MTNTQPPGVGKSRRNGTITLTTILATILLAFVATPVSADCHPKVLVDGDPMMMDWQSKMGPYTYIQTNPDDSLASNGDNTVTDFIVEFTKKATIHLQVWTRDSGNGFRLKYDQIFSAAEAGVHEVFEA